MGRSHPSLPTLALSPEREDTLLVSHQWDPEPQSICGRIRRGSSCQGDTWSSRQLYMFGVGMKELGWVWEDDIMMCEVALPNWCPHLVGPKEFIASVYEFQVSTWLAPCLGRVLGRALSHWLAFVPSVFEICWLFVFSFESFMFSSQGRSFYLS